MATRTTNLNLYKPTVGGDTDNWGGFLNNNAAYIDALFTKSGAAVTLHVKNQQIDGTSSYLFDSVKFDDNRKALFGTGLDLEIYHNGSNSFVGDVGTGDLYVFGQNNIYLANDASGSESYLTATKDGAVSLFYDNAAKLATASGGVNITGSLNILAEGDLRLQDASGGEYVGFDAPATVSGSYTLTLPAAVGSSGQILRTSDGSGTLEWVTDQEGDITEVVAGAGLTGGGAGPGAVTLNAVGTSNRITVNADDIDIASTYVGQSSITTLGTITTGVWNGTAIANANLANSTVSYGGVSVALGASDATPAFNLSDATAYTGDSSLVASGALNSGSITSGFGNIDVGSSNIDGGTITADTALVGTLSTAAQGNITSVGTLTSLTTSGDITMGATDKLYLDGGSNTYIHESSADTMRFFCGGTSRFQIQADGVMIPSGGLLYLDNGGNTYITEGSADVMRFYAGGAKQFECSGTNLTVVGALSKGSGSFRIDHPLDSMKDTHDLVHSFIEGPRADLMYRGSVQLSEGTATVDLDDAATMTDGTWELLCRDPQVWVQNEDGWTQVRGSVSGSTLTITAQDEDCTDTVSWLVVAERQDEHMMDTNWTDEDGRVIVEPEKDSEPEGSESEDDGA